MTTSEYEDDLTEIRGIIIEISSSLPKEISASALGVKSKNPYLTLCAREALIWRTEDLGRCAIFALENQNLASATLLARGIFEGTAVVWHLRDLISDNDARCDSSLHQNLSKILLGWKSDKSLPAAYNVLTLIDKIDRSAPGARTHYDSLSEMAHPNWSGVAGLYSKIVYSEYKTLFGKDDEKIYARSKSIASSLVASLSLFLHAYNSISDIMPVWISELEQI